MSAIKKSQIFNYKSKDFMEISHPVNSTCEEICMRISKSIGILPSARLLFGLRIEGTRNWLAPCRLLKSTKKYEFRVRFKVPQLSTLKKLDEKSYDYFYHQARFDLVNGLIDEIKYPTHKDEILGFAVVDMYIDFLEQQLTTEYLEKNYKKYLTKQLIKHHQYFAKKKLCDGLRDIKKTGHDLFYVKNRYIDSILEKAPNYLTEEYKGCAEYLDEDELQQTGTCPVLIQFNPHHPIEPGLRVYYNYKSEWKHITRIEKIYALYREGKYFIRFEISDLPNGYRLKFHRPAELKSFLSYVSGYYRLIVKWMLDLCAEYYTPSLLELKEFKIHGPIGGDFSYSKIREKNKKSGSYIIRQCEKEYDTYYIDINTRENQTETFKISRECKKWNLFMQECIRPFDKLTDLALSIETTSEQKFRIPPSEYDKPPLLLICLPKNQVTVKKTVDETSEAGLQKRPTQIIDPKTDLLWYKNSYKDCDGGLIPIKAEWILPGDMHKIVTLKVLKSEKYVPDFFKLANVWSKTNSPEFLKLYGITLQTPHTMVMEYSKYGPLNEFLLKEKTNVSLLCLLEAVHNLVRAIVYMQEHKIIHGFIRCSTLQVVKYDGKKIVAKLSDPGFPKSYRAEDLPWIPFEYHQRMELAKADPCAEFWAFSTTVWEIFARGKPIENLKADVLRQNYKFYGGILPEPDEVDFPEEIYPIILDGWSSDPEKRFNQQYIFSRLASITESSLPNYSDVGAASSHATELTSLPSGSLRSNSSSGITDHTKLNGGTCCGSAAGSDPGSINSFSENSFYYDKAPLLHQRQQRNRYNSHNGSLLHNSIFYPQSYFEETPSVVQLSDSKVIYKEKIGEGHYGTVFRGELHFRGERREPKQVAIKTLKSCFDHKALNQDFMREIQIMKSLNHPNIVKILRWIEKPQISIIMEYVECGSFIIYLSSKPNLTNEKLLRFAIEIASGMDYLRSKNVIHRDLAARNILVDSECVKISDFGLAQIADSDGYYFVKSDREIPIKWYAPETIKTNKFSFQSDVWSYGVTLFEMFSRGQQPNLDQTKDLNQTEILDRLENGDRLQKPSMCPENVYEELMWPCWNKNPKSRPDFRQITQIIQNLLSENGELI